MNRFVMTAAAIIAFALATSVSAAGNAAAGKTKAAVCAACHGADGNSVNPQFPKLAGQNANYLVEQLQDFKSGKRRNAIMSGMAASLSVQDMQDIAAWFSSQTVQPGEANPSLVTIGQQVYRGGDRESGVPACLACHGPDGVGNPPMKIPQLAGQHAAYVVAQLQAYASGQRTTDPHKMMETIASRLSDAQMQAVASYIEGLHGTPIRP